MIRYDFRATCVRFRTYAVSALMGGLEGCKPSKILSFRLVWLAKPATPGEKKIYGGGTAALAPPPRNSYQIEILSRNVVKCEHDLIHEMVDKSHACK